LGGHSTKCEQRGVPKGKTIRQCAEEDFPYGRSGRKREPLEGVILTTETPEFIKDMHDGEEKGEGESG
jgi:hypothetical protein